MADSKTSSPPNESYKDEKEYSSNHVDEAMSPDRQRDTLDHDDEYTVEERRKIIHRVDRRLIITCGIMYCVSLMDRTNLSAAAIAGMLVDLRLTGYRYVSEKYPIARSLRS